MCDSWLRLTFIVSNDLELKIPLGGALYPLRNNCGFSQKWNTTKWHYLITLEVVDWLKQSSFGRLLTFDKDLNVFSIDEGGMKENHGPVSQTSLNEASMSSCMNHWFPGVRPVPSSMRLWGAFRKGLAKFIDHSVMFGFWNKPQISILCVIFACEKK